MRSVNDLRNLQNMRHSQHLQDLNFLHRIAKFALFTPLVFFTLIFPPPVYSQSINISNFYYRDYLDFGQNKGVFKDGAESSTGIEITGKNGEKLKIPHIPNFYASSNNGNLTAVGRGFTATANHVTSAEQQGSSVDLRRWGLTEYQLAKENNSSGDTVESVSQPYGRDDKFLRFQKYIIEGQAEMLDITNSINKSDKAELDKEDSNKKAFNAQMAKWANSSDDKRVLIYQAGSGLIALRGNSSTEIDRRENGETKGGGFGYIPKGSNTGDYGSYWDLITGYGAGNTRGLVYNYSANSEQDFNNRITSGDSGSGFYVYDGENKKWLLLGVTSRNSGAEKPSQASNSAEVAFISNKDLENYRQKFEQKINLVVTESGKNTWQLNNQKIENIVRGDTQKQEHILNQNKDIIFKGGGEVEVSANIYRNTSGYAGGFVFESANSATNYTFKNKAGGNYSFNGSGLDIGENVSVEWHLKNPDKNESLHKVGKGTLVVKTQNDSSDNLGTLKIGEGKVVLDASKKAYDGIYLTSGRGSLELKQLAGLGATKSQNQARSGVANAANTYTLEQKTNSEMGFYFGTGGGTLDLAGKSLVLNTIAANDRFAVVKSQNEATLEIEGFGYKTDGTKENTKANTIIHASVGDTNSNIDLQYSGNKSNGKAKSAIQNSEAHLIFDGNINTKGKMEVTNGNVALQGHATTHATISDENLRNQIKTAESGTQKPMPDYMDLSKPSTLTQPDWDNRTFKFGTGGIDLKNSTLTLGRNASLDSNISLDSSSKVEFGAGITHFIDNKDGKNVTGSGFSYQQEVESGNLTGEAEKGANESISYKGKITANGGTIQSHILDFNASLDLKGNANLTADYLTIQKSSSIKLASGTSASVKTLKLNNVSDSDLATIFTNGSGNSKLKVTDMIWFDNTSDLTLTQLDSANIEKGNYDIWATKSSVNDAQKEVTANVELFEGSNFTLKSLTLKNITDSAKSTKSAESTQSAESSTKINRKTTKYLVHLGNTTSTSNFTKLTLSEKLSAQNLDSAVVELRGKSELKAQSIEFSSVKEGKLILDSEAKLTGANGNANIVVSGENSTLKIEMLGDKSFDINASGAGTNITLSSLQSAESSENISVDSAIQNAKFSGKITAKDSSVITTALDSITASVDLQGTAKLTAKNIELTNGFDSIKLQGGANLTADKITAKNLTQLTLQTNGATANVKEFIFDGGTTNLTGNLIGDKITLQNSSIVKNGELSFSIDSSVVFSDATSKLEVTNLKVTSGNLMLNFHDSKQNADKITKIDLSGSGSVNINSWDFGNATQFQSNGSGGRVTFGSASYTQNGTAKTISADSTINGVLNLSNVGKAQSTQARNIKATDSTNRFEVLKFSDKNLTLGENSTISVIFDSSISKSGYSTAGITLGQYYTLISTGGITDNRVNKIIDFKFSNESDKLFVVGRFFDNKELKIKFTEADPRTFSELNKHINPRYSDVLKALTEAHPSDYAIEVAANTDDYAVLESRIMGIDEAMNEIAQGNKSRITQNLLFSNEHTINTRISQVRLARASHNKSPLRFAQNGTLYRLQKMRGEAVASDAMPSYRTDGVSGDELPNNAWLNVGGGYFGGSSQMGFGATNIGYDRLFNADSGDVLVGAMLGFGGARGVSGAMSENARFYNVGLYTHTIFDARGEIYGGHEIQGNVNFSVSENSKRFEGDSNALGGGDTSAWGAQNADSVAFGTLLSVYYKYNFIVVSDENISHAVKPVVLFSVGYNRNGAFKSAEYRQNAYASANLSYGLGVEYNAVMGASFYSVSVVLKDMAWRGNERVDVSLNGARNFIGYILEGAPRLSAEISVVGSHKITPEFYVQYGITGMVDSGANYGVKGDVKVGYKF